MIKLRRMKEDEFPTYRNYSMLAYGNDLAANYGYTLDHAADVADRKLIETFPDGIEASEHDLCCIEFGIGDAAQLVGYLWYHVSKEDKTAFIYDFFVFEDFRGCGIGTQVVDQLETIMRNQGIEFLNLRVAKDNERAKKMYEQLDFDVTGYNMTKKL